MEATSAPQPESEHQDTIDSAPERTIRWPFQKESAEVVEHPVAGRRWRHFFSELLSRPDNKTVETVPLPVEVNEVRNEDSPTTYIETSESRSLEPSPEAEEQPLASEVLENVVAAAEQGELNERQFELSHERKDEPTKVGAAPVGAILSSMKQGVTDTSTVESAKQAEKNAEVKKPSQFIKIRQKYKQAIWDGFRAALVLIVIIAIFSLFRG